ncbi:MAG: ribonuclease catalytic domain-containing protein [Desulfovibrionaceae bacterium]|nr:ribonuclease catalytic domain-containing protein [Desulfovibrionaceae bacterium]
MQQFPGSGCIVEFMHGNEPQLAWVLEETGGRLRLYTINKREMKLPAARVLPWVGPCDASVRERGGMLERLCACETRRAKAAAEVDAMEIWELAQGEVREETAGWFAGLLWESPGFDQVAGLGRALLACKTHFKFHPPKFEVYPAEVVDRRLVEQAAALERERVVTAGQGFFKELWTAWAAGTDRDAARLAARLDPEAADKLRQLLLGLVADPENADLAVLWGTLRKGLPDHPFLPLVLAEQWGVVPPHYNYLLDQAGYEPGDAWSGRFAGEIAAMREASADTLPEPEPIPFVSVDSPTTRDIDDAFHIEPLPDDGFLLRLALADPASGWRFDDPLDRAVARRASSIYLPEGTSHMMPEAFAADLFSLVEASPRPALIMEWNLDAAGATRDFSMRSSVAVVANRTYADVEAELTTGAPGQSLALAARLSGVLRERRVAAGAAVIERSEPDVVLVGPPDDPQVDLAPSDQYPTAQLLVSELMILANSSAAAFAAAHGFALLFRTQDAVLPKELAGIWSRPEDIHHVVKHLPPTSLEPAPRPHAAIGAKAYATVTSPLRRYVDLVNLAQLRHFLATGSPKWSRAELEQRLPDISAQTEAAGRIQRFRPRYWKLLHIRQQCRVRTWTGVVVESGGAFVTLALPDFQIYVRANREQLGEKIRPGQPFALRLGKVDPLTNELRVMEATEMETE